jgi:hypothetical protein
MTLMNKSGFSVVVLCVLVSYGLSGILDAQDGKGKSLLDFLLNQNAEARRKVSTVSYKCQWESEATVNVQGPHLPPQAVQGPQTIRMHILAEEAKKGKWRFSSTEQLHTSVYSASKQTREQERHELAVFNDDYAACWKVGNIYAYQFDHESLTRMSDRAEAHLLLQSIDPIEYGFGGQKDTLMEFYQKVKDETRFTAEKSTSDGRSVFHIKQFPSHTSDADRPACVYTIDPEKGFLITGFTAYHADGTLERECEVQVEKIPGYGIWLPTRIREKAYRRDSETSADLPRLRKTLTIAITDIKVNEPIEDARFTLAALNLPDKVRLMRQMLDGETVPMLKKDGVWLPAPMINRTKEAAN